MHERENPTQSHGRYESEFPRRTDAMPLADITSHTPAPTSFIPTSLPYPGVLPNMPQNLNRPPSVTSVASSTRSRGTLGPGQSSGPRGNFFSLNRRSSKSARAISAPLQNAALGDMPRMSNIGGPRELPGSLYQQRPSFASTARGSIDSSMMNEEVEKLADILPQASRQDLETYLARANGDQSVAISTYLEDQRMGRVQ